MIQARTSILEVHKERVLPAGLTTSDHLSANYLTAPEKMDGVLAYAFGLQGESVLQMLTGGLKNTEQIGNREYKWDLHGSNEIVVECVSDPQNLLDKPGLNNTPFRIVLADNRFHVSDVLVSDDGTQARVQGVENNGMEFIYSMQLITPNEDAYIKQDQVKAGARWSKDYSIVEEYSTRGGGVNYSAPMTLLNQLTTIRKTYEITRSAATDVMIVKMYDHTGKNYTEMWTKLAEWNALAEWYREVDKVLLYSEYNQKSDGTVSVKGENGRPVYSGAGLRQQISPSNKRTFYRLTYDLLDSFLLDLSYAANVHGVQKTYNFVGLTGKLGMREFNRAINEYRNGAGITVTDSGTFITGSGSNLTLDGHFNTVKFLNNISITMKEFPPYDDVIRNRTLHPESNKPLESYRITILNFGTLDGRPNIVKVAKKQSEFIMWYVNGSFSPTGPSKEGQGNSGIDGYEVHLLAEIGIKICDPTSCGELIPIAA